MLGDMAIRVQYSQTLTLSKVSHEWYGPTFRIPQIMEDELLQLMCTSTILGGLHVSYGTGTALAYTVLYMVSGASSYVWQNV